MAQLSYAGDSMCFREVFCAPLCLSFPIWLANWCKALGRSRLVSSLSLWYM